MGDFRGGTVTAAIGHMGGQTRKEKASQGAIKFV